MTETRKRILEKAIGHYGERQQINKAVEELSELIRALARGDDLYNISEEMADVRIMLNQLELIYGNHNEVEAWEYNKLYRLNGRLEKEKRKTEPEEE